MEEFRYLKKIKEIYLKGGNIIENLKKIKGNSFNSIEDILISYDFQSGSYIKDYLKNPDHLNNYSASLAKVINELGSFKSILEIGVGEATTLNLVLKNLIHSPQEILGFDISWSRIKFAKDFSNSDLNLNSNINFFTANLFQIPLLDNCIDIVYTSHSLEPNGGREKEALIELYRVTKKYLILLEPSFELGNFNSKERMKKHGYVTELFKTASELNFKIIEYKLFEHSSNPLNPTGLLIIEKGTESNSSGCDLVCPITLTSLSKHNNHLLYSKDSCLSYPIIEGIPCLLKENAILTSHLITKI